MIGKWHLGFVPSLSPTQRGFDYFSGFLGAAINYWNNGVYATDNFTQQAVSYINNNATHPFFLYLAYNAPHSPYDTPPATYMNQVANIADPNRQIYAAMVTALDAGVGQVLQALQNNNLLNNTLIFFLSDNGAPSSPYTQPSNYPLRGYKYSLFEGGIRVPFAIQWTGTLPANTVYNQPVSSLDIVATVAAAAGVSLATDRVYDGINLLPYLTGQQVSPQRTLFWRWFELGSSGPWGSGSTVYAARSGDLKLFLPGSRLFNLVNDIGETTDLSKTQSSDLTSLQQSWNQWNAQMIEPLWTAGNGWSPNQLVLAGDWNGFNITNAASPWALTRISAPGAQGSPDGFDWYTSTIHAASDGTGDTTPGMHSFVLVASQSYSNQWGGVTINIDDFTVLPFFSGYCIGTGKHHLFGGWFLLFISDSLSGISSQFHPAAWSDENFCSACLG